MHLNRLRRKLGRRIAAILIPAILIALCSVDLNWAANNNTVRYSVLILDTSGSMDGDAIVKERAAAIKFCSSVLQSSGENHIALVNLNTDSGVLCDFTNDYDEIERQIESIEAYGGTNINSALELSAELLDYVNAPAGAIRNIILCTDGLPESGNVTEEGPYDYDDYVDYAYANYAYATAQSLRADNYIYTLGFFHSMEAGCLDFARTFLNDIQNAGYYEVTDPEELKFAFGDIAEDIEKGNENTTFTYGAYNTAPCFYNDGYFKRSSYKYNPSLATMSLAFAMSAFGNDSEPDYKNKSVNAQKLLKDVVGVSIDQIEVNDWFKVKPTTDSIGVVAGNKKIKNGNDEYTLIALAVRGGGYEREWASNFTIGTSGQHSGFDEAKDNVLNFLASYIEDKGISGPVKIWVTGYSRAAATANLIGGELDQVCISPNISYDNADVYVYCFETPAGALTSEVKGDPAYDNIFNIINLNDPVPYVAPADMGFGRYGIDKFLPSKATTAKDYSQKKKKMMEIFTKLPDSGTYVVDDFHMKKIDIGGGIQNGNWIANDYKNNFSQAVFLSNYVTILSKDFIKNRDNYVDAYQQEVREICKVVFGCSSRQTELLLDSLSEQAADDWGTLLGKYINPFVSEEEALETISKWLKKAVRDAGIKDCDDNTIESAGIYLADLALAVASNHPNYLCTAISNITGIGGAHQPTLCFAWVASMDPNYDRNAIESFGSGAYRIVRINCDVDVSVADEYGNEMAAIIDEEPRDMGEDGLICGINENGEKYVVLPSDSSYQVNVTSRTDERVNYGISEYSAEAGDFTRIVNYFDIDVPQSQTITGEVPAYSDYDLEYNALYGSDAYYSLRSEDGNYYDPVDLKGEDATSAYYSVDVNSSNVKYGTVIGSGTYQYGSFAQVTAQPTKKGRFIGWYQGNTCVSKDKTYRICITNDTGLTAKFKSNIVKDLTSIKSLSVKKGKKSFVAKWKKPSKKARKKMAKIQVQYSTSKKFASSKTKTRTISKNKTSLTIKKLKSKKTYYVRIRSYKKGKDGIIHISKWSKVKKVKTR